MAAAAKAPPAEADAELEALTLALEEARPSGETLREAPALRLLLPVRDCARDALGEALTLREGARLLLRERLHVPLGVDSALPVSLRVEEGLAVPLGVEGRLSEALPLREGPALSLSVAIEVKALKPVPVDAAELVLTAVGDSALVTVDAAVVAAVDEGVVVGAVLRVELSVDVELCVAVEVSVPLVVAAPLEESEALAEAETEKVPLAVDEGENSLLADSELVRELVR